MTRAPAVAALLGGLLALPSVANAQPIDVTITSPQAGATVTGPVAITAETTGAVSSVAFGASTDAGATWTQVATDATPADGWGASWDPAGYGGPATLRALATDGTSTVASTVDVVVDDAPPALAIQLSRRAFSPNDDGRSDGTVVRIHVEAPVSLTLRVLAPDGQVVRPLLEGEPAGPGDLQVPWEGDSSDGGILPDGRYLISVQAEDEIGGAWAAETVVVLDTRPPSVRWLDVRPDPYRGRGGVHLSFRASDRSPEMTATALVVDAIGRRVARLRQGVVGGTARLRWDGFDAQGREPTPGLRTATVLIRDDAGNVGASRPRPFRDHRPVTTRVVRRVEGAGNRVALTFDDCYDEAAWERILDVLDARDAGGSFFCLGPYVRANPGLARRTVASGHTIGSHGWDHASVLALSASELRNRVRREAGAWWQVAGATPVPFYRPVGGEYSAQALGAVGQEGFSFTVLWDVDPWDWSRPGAPAIAQRVLAHARGGSIVVLHAIDQSASALPAIIDGLRARGLEPVTLTELLRAGA